MALRHPQAPHPAGRLIPNSPVRVGREGHEQRQPGSICQHREAPSRKPADLRLRFSQARREELGDFGPPIRVMAMHDLGALVAAALVVETLELGVGLQGSHADRAPG